MAIQNLQSIEQGFHDFLKSLGHPLDVPIDYDSSKFHQFKCPHGNSTDARYKLYCDEMPAGYFKCWHCDLEETYTHKQETSFSQDDWQKYKETIDKRRQEYTETRKQSYLEAAKEAALIWESASPCEAHPYLLKKNIKSFGLRVAEDGKTLLVPCFDSEGNLVNLERIFYDASKNNFSKRPIREAQRTGAYYLIGDASKSSEICYLAEGYSTAAAVHESTGFPCAVSFNCGNLAPVATIISEKFPKAKVIIAADSDANKAGETHAQKAISELKNACYMLPNFSDIPNDLYPEVKRSDYNDLLCLLIGKGLDRKSALDIVYEQLSVKATPHSEILNKLLDIVKPIDFRKISQLDDKEKLSNNHFQIISVEYVLELAKNNNWGLCRNHDFIYLYNGFFWSLLGEEELKTFLGLASEKMGIDKFRSKHHIFRNNLFEQFIALANFPKPEQPKNTVLINLQNGTFKITPTEISLKAFDRGDFITYQLSFAYNPTASAPLFESYLNRVLPDKQLQNILAEYLGYVFIQPSTLKLEKTLLLYGTGANGKSVFYEIVRNLLGEQNCSEYSLQSLTDHTGYYRGMIANKLVNYASEINGRLEASIFKQLVSGEPVEARLPYGRPFTISQYAKLIFNCNELPRDVEQTEAFFRRFLIVPFEVTIPESEQDKQLASRIVENELSGVFNWVLNGLIRLLQQKNFTECDAVKKAREQYELESDSVGLFLQEQFYISNASTYIEIKYIYNEYREFCSLDGLKACSKVIFIRRLKNKKILVQRRKMGNVAFLIKQEA